MSIIPPDVSPVDRNHLPYISGKAFVVYKIKHLEALWVAPCYREKLGSDENTAQLYRSFCDRFAYAMPDCSTLQDLEFDLSQSRIYWAERYGGRGIGFNGGGARVGNAEGFQIKGVGRNPLAGNDTEFMHSYGAMTAAEGMYEAIYAYLLNLVMPVGAAQVYGIILTAPNAAYQLFNEGDAPEAAEDWRCWGALLVREVCRRPGHFLRAPAFVPPLGLAPDLPRVRAVNKTLYREFGSAKNFVAYLGDFLSNCANQFAYARVMRLAHGALTASNLCMDGRWLDLSRTTFIPADEDNGALMPSETESNYVILVLNEVLHTFAKFNFQNFNVGKLIEYYKEQFEAYLDYHVAGLLGIDIDHLTPNSSDSYQTLCIQILKVVCARKRRTWRPAAMINEVDPVQQLLLSLFSSLHPDHPMAAALPGFKAPADFDWAATSGAFRVVLEDAMSQQDEIGRRKAYYMRSAVAALKPALLQPIFYKKRMDDQLRLLVRQGIPTDFRELMTSYQCMIDWIFLNLPAKPLYLFRGEHIDIHLDPGSSRFSLTRHSIEYSLTSVELSHKIAAIDKAELVINGYCFQSYLMRLLKVCNLLEGLDD